MGVILIVEVRRKLQGSLSQLDVLVFKNSGRNKQKDQTSKDKSHSKSRSKYKNLECDHCGKQRHIKKFCYKWKRENKGNKSDDRLKKKKMQRIMIKLLLLGLMISLLFMKRI